jgi:putative PIN family toxin of toxin-antitoxin system
VTRVVIDTVIFVRALINRKSTWGEIIFDRFHEYDLVVSPLLVEEYLEVLHRPLLTRKYRMITGEEFIEVLQHIEEAEQAYFEELLRVSRDPNDDKFIATAVAGNAQVIVTEDRDLLDLREYRGIAFLTAYEFAQLLTSKP